MPKKFSGIVRLRQGTARPKRLRADSIVLIPYPRNTPLDLEDMKVGGFNLFRFLRNERATVTGNLIGNLLFSAMLDDVGKPESYVPIERDEFTEKIESIFGADTTNIVARLTDLDITTLAAFSLSASMAPRKFRMDFLGTSR